MWNDLLYYRNWQVRRVAITSDAITFARVDASLLLDAIPLSEVTTIDLMKPTEQGDEHDGQAMNGYESVIDLTHAFQIRTKKDGQNAGRKYILRARSDEEAADTVSHLNRLAKIAAEKTAARTKWDKIHSRVRSVHTSSWFQGMSAALIVAVGLHLIVVIESVW